MPDTPEVWLSEFGVNASGGQTGQQREPQVIQLTDGRILVAWSDDTNNVDTDPGSDIIGQFYDPLGNAIGTPFQMNSAFFGDNESQFEIAATPDGGWILVFEDDGPVNLAIIVEVYDSSGARIDFAGFAEQTGESYNDPTVAVNSNGDAIIAWNVETGGNVFARYSFYDESTGNFSAVSGNVLASSNTTTDGRAQQISVAALTNDGFVLVAADALSGTLNARLITSGGNTPGSIIAVQNSGTVTNSNPDVTGLANGGFAVAWQFEDVSDTDVWTRVYSNAGNPVTPIAFVGTSGVLDSDNEVSVTGLADGNYAIVLDSDDSNTLQLYHVNASTGARIGDIVNFNTGGTQPEVLGLADGRIAIVWEDTITAQDVRMAFYDTRDNANDPPVHTPDSWQVGTVGNDGFDGTGDNIFAVAGNDVVNVTDIVDGRIIDGGAGDDFLTAQGLSNGTVIDLAAETMSFGGATQHIRNFEDYSGAAAHEEIIGTPLQNELFGNSGRDTIDAGAGDDFVDGGSFNDVLDGGPGSDTVNGGDGNDTILYGFGEGFDVVHGGDGTDLFEIDILWTTPVFASLGNSSISSGAESAPLISIEDFSSGSGNDTLQGDDSANMLDGNGGADSLLGEGGADLLLGGDGNDTLRGGLGFDTLRGEAGDDFFDYDPGEGINDIDGGDGDDTLSVISVGGGMHIDLLAGSWTESGATASITGIEDVRGGTGNDTIIGSDAAEQLTGLFGDDTVQGGGGDDTLDGGDGFNLVQGGDGNDGISSFSTDTDTLEGGGGNDYIQDLLGGTHLMEGGDGDDTLVGLSGSDTLIGGRGNDDLTGAEDDDTLRGSNGDDTLRAGAGRDSVGGGNGNDSAEAGSGDDYVNAGNNDDTILGGTGRDTLLGGNQADQIRGGGNEDDIRGGRGNDTIWGDDGDDTINGGRDDDLLIGNDGGDVFLFAGAFGNDTIRDYDEMSNDEKIDFSFVSEITDFIDLLSNHVTQVGADILIEDGLGNSVLVEDALIGDLGGFDFIF